MGIGRINLPEPVTDRLGGLPGAEGAAEELPGMGEDDRDPWMRQRIPQERLPASVTTDVVPLQEPSAHRVRLRLEYATCMSLLGRK